MFRRLDGAGAQGARAAGDGEATMAFKLAWIAATALSLAAGLPALAEPPDPSAQWIRGAKAYEAGIQQRTVIVEFESLEKAIACHDSPAYQAALAALGDGVTRDLRVVEGV